MINWLILRFLKPRLKKFLTRYQPTREEEMDIELGLEAVVRVYRRGKKPKPTLPPNPQSPLPTRTDQMNRSGESRGMGERRY